MLAKIIDIVAPSGCLVCGQMGELLCVACQDEKLVSRTPSCFRCNQISHGGRTCSSCRGQVDLTGVLAALRFEDIAKELVYALKFQSDRSVAKLLASTIAKLVDPAQFDLITFVPSDGATLRRRGYNQARLIARALATQVGLPCEEALLRLKHSPQIGLSRRQRLIAVRDNFVVLPRKIEGQRVLVVDDVLTTGATLSECARVLKSAGARSVWGAVATRK